MISTNRIKKMQIDKEKWISDAAYFKALKRHLRPGLEQNDWLLAEQEYLKCIGKPVKSGLVRLT